MATSIRRVLRLEMNALIARYNNLANAVLTYGVIANGTTAGKLKTTAAVSYRIEGTVYTKAATDDLWDLTGLTNLAAGEFQAIALYLDASGTASIGAGTVAATAAAAKLACPAFVTSKCVVGWFVANASTDFDAALSAQGTIYHGTPTGFTDSSGNVLSADLITSIAP